MTSLLMSKAQTKNTTDVPLITKSAENLGSCLNNMLKVGGVIASGNSNRAQASGVHLYLHVAFYHFFLMEWREGVGGGTKSKNDFAPSSR